MEATPTELSTGRGKTKLDWYIYSTCVTFGVLHIPERTVGHISVLPSKSNVTFLGGVQRYITPPENASIYPNFASKSPQFRQETAINRHQHPTVRLQPQEKSRSSLCFRQIKGEVQLKYRKFAKDSTPPEVPHRGL